MNKRPIQAIDLFSGVGGLTYGLQQAGIKVVAGLDNDPTCESAFVRNNASRFICADVATYDFNEFAKIYSKQSIKVLVGCAPCQPFSSHTFKIRGKKDDKRWNLIDHFVRAVEVTRPEIVSMENVRGVIKTDVFENFVSNLKSLGYYVDYKVIYAPDYGIPQNRSRLVLLASRLGEIHIPKKTHTKEKYVQLKDIIKGLPHLKAGEISKKDNLHRTMRLSDLNQKRIAQSKPGGSWKDWDPKLLPDCYKKESGQSYGAVYGRMSWNDISPTITTQFFNYGSGRFGHPEQNRAISLREGALIQTFPESYDFGDFPTGKIARHIGNAVPPRLGEVIGEAIQKHIKLYGN